MYIQALTNDDIKKEYGIRMRRVYQIDHPPVHPPFGSAWGLIAPEKSSAPHSHHEHETFYITSGEGLMEIEGDKRDVKTGDVIYIPPHASHILHNNSSEDELVFITTWWE